MKLLRRLKKFFPRKLGKVLARGVRRNAPEKGQAASALPKPVMTLARDVSYLSDGTDAQRQDGPRGAIDRVNAEQGIGGWIVDRTPPGNPHRLELVANDTVLAGTDALADETASETHGHAAVRSRFRFALEALLPLAELREAGSPVFVGVRVAGSSCFLRPASAQFTDDVFAALDAYAATAPEQAYRDPLDVSPHLQDRMRLAAALLARPLKPRSEDVDGHIEIAAVLSSDTLMLIGWLKKRRDIDLSAVIVADRRYPAGLLGMSFKRPDLQPPAAGFVAFVRTAWRPVPGAAITLLWGSDIAFRAEATSLRLFTPVEAGQWIAGLEGKATAQAFRDFHRHLSQLDTWVPSEAGLKEAGITYGIDSVTVVPGFGSFAAGWIASPYKRVRGLSLRLGKNVASSDRRSFNLMPRPNPAAPKSETGDRSAGWLFRCVLPGSVRETDLSQPALRMHFEDGTAYAVAVPPQVLRLCSGPDDLTRVARLFPGLASDPSVDGFADAFAATAKTRAGAVVPITVHPCPQVAVLTMPGDEDDLLLALAGIRICADWLPPGVGIVLLASRQTARTRLLEGAAHLRATSARAVSLFGIGEPTYALWSLGAVLAALAADQFWFCGPDVLPTRTGWRAASELFTQGSTGLTLFVRPQSSGAAPEPDSLSFAWTSAAFLGWAETAPFFLEGFHRDNHLPSGPGTGRVEGAVGLLRSMIGAEPIRRTDERLYQQSGCTREGHAPDQAMTAPSWH